VSDPVEAGLLSSLKNHPENITGVMDAPPIKKQMEFIKTLLPTLKVLGVLYNPGDSGSVSSLRTIRNEAKTLGIGLMEATPVKSSDIQAALLQLVGKVDAVYVPLDNMVVSAMKTVSALALKHKLPLFSADSGSVESGALACLGYSYPQIGFKTGEIVVKIFNGDKSSEIDVESPDKLDIFINRNALETLKISLPETIHNQAHFY
jgi:putative ABC transport system substrate-binding protein